MRALRSTVLVALVASAVPCAAGSPARADSPFTPADALPPATEVLAKYKKAIGGDATIRKYRSRRVSGRFELPAQGIGGPFELVAAAPDRMHVRIELSGLGEIVRGYNGSVGWSIDPAVGPRLLTGRELEEVQYSADFYADLYDPALYRSIAVIERAPFEGRDCYTVKLVRDSGFEVLEFFEVATGLRAGTRMSSTSAMGTVPGVTTVFGEYREFDGVLMPTTARQRAMGIESALTIERVEHDTVSADAFELPAGIAALVKER